MVREYFPAVFLGEEVNVGKERLLLVLVIEQKLLLSVLLQNWNQLIKTKKLYAMFGLKKIEFVWYVMLFSFDTFDCQ